MPRPTIDDEVLERLEAVVEERTRVPASHLTTTQRLDFVLDELADADAHVDRLADRVESLEAELEEARASAQPNNRDRGAPAQGPAPVESIDDLDFSGSNNLGP